MNSKKGYFINFVCQDMRKKLYKWKVSYDQMLCMKVEFCR